MSESQTQTHISVLHCPRCGTDAELVNLADGYGFARCECSQMPIAAGVVMGEPGALQDQIRRAVEARDFEQARMLMLGKFASRVRWLEKLGMRITFRRYIRHSGLSWLVERLRIRKILERMPPRRLGTNLAAAAQFNAYIRHRFSAPWTLGMEGLLGLLDGRDGLVMDAPCGMGHLAYVMSKLVEQDRIVCMDLIPGFVYAARRFFVPEAKLTMAFDMNQPLPLRDHAFAMIFCFDSFQHMHDKRQTAREFMRLLRDDGVLALGHVPNGLRPHLYSDRALPPREYLDLFKDFHARMYPGGYLTEQYLSGEPIDLARQFPQEQLDAAQTVDVVAAKSDSVFTQIPNVMGRLLDSAENPQLNALYRARSNGAAIDLELHLPEALAEEMRRFGQILPPKVTVAREDLPGTGEPADPARRRELLRKHVLEDLPIDY